MQHNCITIPIVDENELASSLTRQSICWWNSWYPSLGHRAMHLGNHCLPGVQGTTDLPQKTCSATSL